MSKILVLGYFGYDTNQKDGQTIKTRNIYDLLKSKGLNLSFYDTQHSRKNPLSIFSMIVKLMRCEKLVLIPCLNNLTYLFPVIFIFSVIFRFEIIHIGVGGWLDKYCKEYPLISKLLQRNKIILLENIDTVNSLKDNLKFNNVEYFHNYRIIDYVPIFTQKKAEEPLRIVFMARVNKKKGLDVIFSIADHYLINKSHSIIIDFYGPIEPEHNDYFKENIAKYDFVQYKGILNSDEINPILNNYDLMILPTRYYTEGFPGSILDAYISGIPVLVSNWKHASEFVDDGVNGFICNVDVVDEFIVVIEKLRSNNELLLQMKHSAWKSSHKYSSEAAWDILKNQL